MRLHKIRIKPSKPLRNIVVKVLFALLLTSTLGPVQAATPDFQITTTYDITYNPPNDYVVIEEEITLKANNTEYYYPAQGERMFFLPDFDLQKSEQEREFKKANLTVTDERGLALDTRFVDTDDGIELYIPDNRDITYWNQEQFTVKYQTHELSDFNGNIVNLYIPGLPEDTEFQTTDDKFGITTSYIFNTNLVVPDNSAKASFLSPSDKIDTQTKSNKRIYSIQQQDRIGKTAWIQLGTSQYYYFKMHQVAPKTDNIIPEEISQYTDLISTNIYELPLPKEHDETNQKVFFTNISPTPTNIKLDAEGNYIATFEMPANIESEIIIEGYIVLKNTLDSSPIPNKSTIEYINEVKQDTYLSKYTLPDNYWESDSTLVSNLAKELSTGTNSLLELVEKDYEYIIDTFDYSYEKVDGANDRLGALAALQGADAVCMEYSDALIALLRAQGVAARAAVGYGNDPTGAENIIGDDTALVQNIGHQWLQVWIPDYGWLSVDPTWGESGRRYIGSNLDHILWYTVGNSEQGYVGTSLSTADAVAKYVLTSYDVSLKTLTESEFESVTVQMTPLSDIALQYETVQIDELSTFIKTTSIGKIILITIPLLVLLLGVSIVTGVVGAVIKRAKVTRIA